MKKAVKGKKLYSIAEIYGIAVKAFRSFKDLKRGRKKEIIDEKLQERIMLEVTEVNKCALCSYAHAEMALKAGLSSDEIKSFSEDYFPDIPDEETVAILFAQHYAESRGKPSLEAWSEVVSDYGEEKAKAVLAAARIIMMGNAMGIIFGSIQNRFKTWKGDERSNILYEAVFVLTFIPMFLIAAAQAGIMNLFRVPIVKLKE